jgi:hypothetical protein
VITLGSDPLYDETGKNPGAFEKRIEVYSPPYLFRGERPVVTGGPTRIERGTTVTFTTGSTDVTRARLMRPSAVTHVVDVDQRSVAVGIDPVEGGLAISVPGEKGLLPSGWYMLFLVDSAGVPSEGRWVQVA